MNKTVYPNGEHFSRDDKRTGVNNNICVCGTSGTGKTRSCIIPNMLELSGNYIVTDPKGFLYKKYKKYYEDNGYDVKRISFIHPSESVCYNPLAFVHSTHDIQKLAYSFVKADKSANTHNDPYWDEQALFLINSVFAYLLDCERLDAIEELPANLNSAINYIRKANERSLVAARRDAISFVKQQPSNMYVYEVALDNFVIQYGESFASKQYKNILSAPEKTYSTIVTAALSKFSSLETDELAAMLEKNDINIKDFVNSKSIYFVEVSDTDSSMNLLINIFFTQMLNTLCEYADTKCKNGRLPRDVIFIMDDFPSYYITDFDKIINNIRSRGISTIITTQTLKQLSNVYPNGDAIVSNCDTLLFMGTNDYETAVLISQRTNKPKYEILNMPINTSYIIRRGAQPQFVQNADTEELIESYYI